MLEHYKTVKGFKNNHQICWATIKRYKVLENNQSSNMLDHYKTIKGFINNHQICWATIKP